MSDRVALVAGIPALLSFVQEHERHAVVAHHGCCSATHDKAVSSAPEQLEDRPAAKSCTGAGAEKVLRSFNTWAFKREQPSDPRLMLRVISEALAGKEPIPFVLYWGKGPRHEAGAPDGQCLDFLAALASRVRGAHPQGAAIKLIFTDTHAELNGHCPHDIRRYFDEIERLAHQRGIDGCWMSHLVRTAGNLATAAPLEGIVSAETLSRLTASALKWYRGGDTPEEGALKYLRMNLIEQRVVERAFSRSIFISFSGSELRNLFPRQLPIFYMYSLRRGVSVKPWFLPADAANPSVNLVQENASRPAAT
jgi:L-tyrosine isonitrile synthase